VSDVTLDVRSFDSRHLAQVPTDYDIVVATVGYEPRARAVATAIGEVASGAAAGFERNHEYAYEENRDWFRGNGFHFEQPPEGGYRAWLEPWLSQAVAGYVKAAESVRIGIDISSMTRDRIAVALETVRALAADQPLDVDFLYAPSAYCDPPEEPDFTASIEPVTSYFRGWTPDPSRPTAALVGLGYEIDKAVGAKEYLELKDLWAFIAEGGDPRFADKVRDNNNLLWREVDEERIIRYPLTDPFGVFVQLESQLFGALRQGRALMLPMGPKIFALCSMLAAMHHHPDVGVWRVRQSETPQPREADGTLLGVSVGLAPSPAPAQVEATSEA
jgi:hypothetical protein